MIQYDKQTLQLIEEEISYIYDSDATGYPEGEYLLDLRKRILNEQACTRKAQEELLSHIIAFNDALRDALKHMHDRAHELYRQISAIQPDIELETKCLLPYKYPSLHPFQHESRQELWESLCDTGWNPLYESGVTHSIELPRDINLSFDEFIGMNLTPANWNENLDQSLTKDLHLINAFHNLFDHTNFALTDFIFCCDFEESINIAVNSHLSGEA
ncbi:MAG: hypothetical protein IKP93_03675 [Paludibacteraceae bacterium]|nr:hypothetical protein [Paludibacteraceae bacterium]